jgi:hypothetical protein
MNDKKSKVFAGAVTVWIIMNTLNLNAIIPDCEKCECQMLTGVILFDSHDIPGGGSCFKMIYYYYEKDPVTGLPGNPITNGSKFIVYTPFIGPVLCPGGSNNETVQKIYQCTRWGIHCECKVTGPTIGRQMSWPAPPYTPPNPDADQDERDDSGFNRFQCSGSGGGA